MRRGGNRQQLGNALNDAEKANFGVAESDKAGIEPFGASNGHDSIFLEFAGAATPNPTCPDSSEKINGAPSLEYAA